MKWSEKIEAHYRQVWEAFPEACPFSAGPINDLPSDFKVLAFPPHAGRSVWTYATCGMSLPGDSNAVELHLFSPRQDAGLVELLFTIAHFHRTGAQLNLWHTVNFGRSWLGESICNHGLISLPYLDGPRLENLADSAGTIKFYWLIPITKAELEFKKAAGIDALEARLEEASFDYADPARSSVI